MISRFSRASLFCRFSSLISSLASISSFTSWPSAVVKPTVSPFWQDGEYLSPSAMCVLPVPLLPIADDVLATLYVLAACELRDQSCLFTGRYGYRESSKSVQALDSVLKRAALILRATIRWWRSMSSSSASLSR